MDPLFFHCRLRRRRFILESGSDNEYDRDLLVEEIENEFEDDDEYDCKACQYVQDQLKRTYFPEDHHQHHQSETRDLGNNGALRAKNKNPGQGSQGLTGNAMRLFDDISDRFTTSFRNRLIHIPEDHPHQVPSSDGSSSGGGGIIKRLPLSERRLDHHYIDTNLDDYSYLPASLQPLPSVSAHICGGGVATDARCKTNIEPICSMSNM